MVTGPPHGRQTHTTQVKSRVHSVISYSFPLVTKYGSKFWHSFFLNQNMVDITMLK